MPRLRSWPNGRGAGSCTRRAAAQALRGEHDTLAGRVDALQTEGERLRAALDAAQQAKELAKAHQEAAHLRGRLEVT